MADLSITAANVRLATSLAQVVVLQVSEAVDAGEVVYKNGQKYSLADASASGTAAASYLALTSGVTDGYIVALKTGLVYTGTSSLTKGVQYVVSATAGKIAPIGDLGTGDYITHVGVANATDTLYVDVAPTGQQA